MELIEVAHQRLLVGLVDLTDIQVRQPSLLPDWTVGHTLSHIALNAEAFVRVAKGLALGLIGPMYPTMQSRNADIDAGAQRTAAEIVDHLNRAHEAFMASWASLDAEQINGDATTAPGMPTFPAATIPDRRLREIEVHGADSGVPALTYNGWSEGYVAADFPIQFSTVAARLDPACLGFAVLDEVGTAHVAGQTIGIAPVVSTRREILAWTLNRIQPAGFPALTNWQAPPPISVR
jgi:maleylpyruvate isomerase